MSAGTADGVRVAAATDVGRVRERNEDSFFTGRVVFAVADGLGGHRAGEVASSAALEPLAELDGGSATDAVAELAGGVRRGNRTVYERAQADPDLRGMGTTMTAVAVHGGAARVAHVGDSRCYLIRNGEISQVTEDHTVVARMVAEGRLTPEQAESHPQRSLLLRALGADDQVDVDEADVPLEEGDRLLLCSDGLYSVISDPEILDLAGDGDDLEGICRRLIDEANGRGGPDNITVVLLEVGAGALEPAEPASGGAAARPPRIPRERRRMPAIPTRAVVWSLVALTVVLGGFFVLRTAVQSNYFVGEHEGRVAIFRGLPAGGLSALSSVAEEPEPPVRADRLDPADRRKLSEGIRANDLEDARSIVVRLREKQLLPGEQASGVEPSP